MPKDCEDDGTNGTISDPTMCTIMNSIPSVKNSYIKKYDEGNEYCTIYCRESLKFTFMDKENATLAVGVKYLMADAKSQANFGVMYAGLVIVMIPTLVLYICVQKKITQGMSIGGMKE